MNCAKARKMLPLFAGGEIDAFRRQEAERHLTQCSGCRQALTEYKALVELTRSTSPMEISDEIERSLVRDIINRSRDTGWGEFNSNYRNAAKKTFRLGHRLAGVTAVIAIAIIAAFIVFGTPFIRGSRGPGVEDYLLHADLRGLCNALLDEDSRERLLDESVSVDLLIQTVEKLQRNRTFQARIEHRIDKSLRSMKNDLRESPARLLQDGSPTSQSLTACAKPGGDQIRFENILRTLRCLRRSNDHIKLRDILLGLEFVMET